MKHGPRYDVAGLELPVAGAVEPTGAVVQERPVVRLTLGRASLLPVDGAVIPALTQC